MQAHPMPEFGSFSLMLALVLAAYTLVAGGTALLRPANTLSAKLGETAPRAGRSTFVTMPCAAFARVWAAFTNDYSASYILPHTNRALPGAYKFAALWSGQE